ncbi:hypothetical protein WJX72_008468 [[Myrmecia] bisecta]|uniref:N-acetyltransferase domain-containing protein n=1 Tax=[Myrmecia] bisecta TaxID=41462 RepID=A0AAW1QFZ4_9CHLO
MKDNYNTTVTGSLVKLVPYRPHHVERYHQWMQDPDLLEATASERLSLQEEYEMQQSWADDPKKCTFIILDRARPDTAGTEEHGGGMAGDVNVFLNDLDDPTVGEIEVMVAEGGSRRKGVAFEALSMFMAYLAAHMELTRFRAKIGDSNASSLQLFRKLGFQQVSHSEVFREQTLEWAVDAACMQRGVQLVLGTYDN